MNKYLSSKIKIISFICIIMVVFLHCYNFTDNFLLPQTTISEGLNIATFIEFFLCNGFTRIAVPIFFMISGYLFFLTYKLSIEKYFYKVKSRFLSLMIPYLIWSIIGIGLCYLLKNIDIMPINDMKTNYSDGGFFNVLYNPPNFQFWFIKQLFIYTILSPIIYLLVKYSKISKNKIIISLILWLVILCLKTVLAGIFTQDFIYCFHEPLLDIVIQYTLVFLANSFAFNLVTYFIYPTCAILIAILLSSILLKYAPSLHNILTGNRGTRRKK